METELYSAIQSLIALIEKTDFTRQVTINLDLGMSMLGLLILIIIISALLGFVLGSAWQEKKIERIQKNNKSKDNRKN